MSLSCDHIYDNHTIYFHTEYNIIFIVYIKSIFVQGFVGRVRERVRERLLMNERR